MRRTKLRKKKPPFIKLADIQRALIRYSDSKKREVAIPNPDFFNQRSHLTDFYTSKTSKATSIESTPYKKVPQI